MNMNSFKNLNVELKCAIKGVCCAVSNDSMTPNVSIDEKYIAVTRLNHNRTYTDKQIESIRRGLLPVLHCCFDIEKTDYGFNVKFAE